MPPGSITLSSANFSVSYGTTTKRSAHAQKAADQTARHNGCSARQRLNEEVVNLADRLVWQSFQTTLLPTTLDERQPARQLPHIDLDEASPSVARPALAAPPERRAAAHHRRAREKRAISSSFAFLGWLRDLDRTYVDVRSKSVWFVDNDR